MKGRAEIIRHYSKMILKEENRLMTSRNIYKRMVTYPVKNAGLLPETITMYLRKFPDEFKFHSKVYPGGNRGVGKWEYIGE